VGPLAQKVREHAEGGRRGRPGVRQDRERAGGALRRRPQTGDAPVDGHDRAGAGAPVAQAYHLLGLQSYYTAGPKEIRAWTVPIGSTAPQAAGVIHTDFERGFIRAEIYSVADLEKFKTEKAIKEAGKMRIEGKDYVMQDGTSATSCSMCERGRRAARRGR
jgi:hypothetical protein